MVILSQVSHALLDSLFQAVGYIVMAEMAKGSIEFILHT